MTYDDDTIDWNTVPPAKMFHMVMLEIVDSRNELIERMDSRMDSLKAELKGEIAEVKQEVKKVQSELHTLRLEVHQNHATFIANQTDVEKRVRVLEMAA